MKPVYYSQYDSKWANVPYTIDGDKHETISYSGCGPTCVAMILASWVDKKITPVFTAALAIKMGDRTANNGTEWEYFKHIAERYSLEFKQSQYDKDCLEALKKGALVVCSMGKGAFTKSGHFILAWDYDGKSIKVNDPASRLRSLKSWGTDVFHRECRQYFIFYEKKGVKAA